MRSTIGTRGRNPVLPAVLEPVGRPPPRQQVFLLRRQFIARHNRPSCFRLFALRRCLLTAHDALHPQTTLAGPKETKIATRMSLQPPSHAHSVADSFGRLRHLRPRWWAAQVCSSDQCSWENEAIALISLGWISHRLGKVLGKSTLQHGL